MIRWSPATTEHDWSWYLSVKIRAYGEGKLQFFQTLIYCALAIHLCCSVFFPCWLLFLFLLLFWFQDGRYSEAGVHIKFFFNWFDQICIFFSKLLGKCCNWFVYSGHFTENGHPHAMFFPPTLMRWMFNDWKRGAMRLCWMGWNSWPTPSPHWTSGLWCHALFNLFFWRISWRKWNSLQGWWQGEMWKWERTNESIFCEQLTLRLLLSGGAAPPPTLMNAMDESTGIENRRKLFRSWGK